MFYTSWNLPNQWRLLRSRCFKRTYTAGKRSSKSYKTKI